MAVFSGHVCNSLFPIGLALASPSENQNVKFFLSFIFRKEEGVVRTMSTEKVGLCLDWI